MPIDLFQIPNFRQSVFQQFLVHRLWCHFAVWQGIKINIIVSITISIVMLWSLFDYDNLISQKAERSKSGWSISAEVLALKSLEDTLPCRPIWYHMIRQRVIWKFCNFRSNHAGSGSHFIFTSRNSCYSIFVNASAFWSFRRHFK